LVSKYPLRTEPVEIHERLQSKDQLSDVPAHRVTLLEPVSAEPVGQIQPTDLGPLPEDGVAIESVDRIKTAPTSSHPEAGEGGQSLGENRPDHFLEPIPAEGEVESDRIVGKGPCRDERPRMLRKEVDPVRQKHAGKLILDRSLQSEHGAHHRTDRQI